MNKLKHLLSILLILSIGQSGLAQDFFLEGLVGIGNIPGGKHRAGKAEIQLTVLRNFKFGTLGIDFSTGGNLLPINSTVEDSDLTTHFPDDSRFGSIVLLYRYPIKKTLFVEPRIGYASLNTNVFTDDHDKLTQGNLSAGIGLGVAPSKLIMSVRYQYLGKTTFYEGFSSFSNSFKRLLAGPVSLVMFRMSYRFSLDRKREKTNLGSGQ